MKIRKHLLLPALAFATASVLVFSGIGIAAFTGNGDWRTATLSGSPAGTAPAEGAESARRTSPNAAATCPNCGVVQSIESAASDEMSTSTGAPPAARTAGSGGRRATIFVVRLRMDDGSQRVIQELFEPAFSVGQRIRVVNGLLLASG